MGVRIIHSDDEAVMYCSVTGWAFGPVFDDSDEHGAYERLELFLDWLPNDPRKYTQWLTVSEIQSMAQCGERTVAHEGPECIRRVVTVAHTQS